MARRSKFPYNSLEENCQVPPPIAVGLFPNSCYLTPVSAALAWTQDRLFSLMNLECLFCTVGPPPAEGMKVFPTQSNL
ncbi:hypothetical protein Y1Q_0012612 [Alligator mississippiensis]|uniref:Uncharacterized protein n=1 Tax=Alligator mississippiensis TaxID=8496 RepID=A0A151M8A2_ALLMI|nr:hypothetical protein Y1Q_0012612 [Alligator mississippiensis]